MRLSTLVLLICLFSCTVDSDKTVTPSFKIVKGASVNIEYIGNFASKSPTGEARNVAFLEQLDFIPLFIGDTLAYPSVYYHGMYTTLVIERWYYGPEAPDITVHIDTTRALSGLYQWEFDMGMGRDVMRKDPRKSDWYPVFITNKDPDSLMVGYDFSLELIVEAKDRNGNWRSIHRPSPAGCGVGKYQILLPSYQYALTALPRYTGDFQTTARLKLYSFENTYSNEFTISINESQFLPEEGGIHAFEWIDLVFYDKF